MTDVKEELLENLLTYGEFIDDKERQDNEGNYIRYRLISFVNNLYLLYMKNRDVIELKKVGKVQ